MFPILQVGPLAIQTPGLIILLGLWLGLVLSEKFCTGRGIQPNHLYNLVFVGLLVGIIGGRILYILRFPDPFIRNPQSIISLNPGLFILEEGLLLGVLGMVVYGNQKHLKIWETLDALTPCLEVLAVAVGFAHVASGAAFGSETSLPWGIQLWGAQRHPAQIIETVTAIVILAVLWPGRKFVKNWPAGIYFLTFICLASFSLLIRESISANSTLLINGIRAGQVIAWLVLIVALVLRRRQITQASSSHN